MIEQSLCDKVKQAGQRETKSGTSVRLGGLQRTRSVFKRTTTTKTALLPNATRSQLEPKISSVVLNHSQFTGRSLTLQLSPGHFDSNELCYSLPAQRLFNEV